MIIGFSHLTYASAQNNATTLFDANISNWVVFENAANHPSKQKFMHHEGASHSLFLNYKLKPSIEIAKYEFVDKTLPTPISLLDSTIILQVQDLETEIVFFKKLGLSSSSSQNISLQAPIASWNVDISLKQTSSETTYKLDAAGFVALAFYTRDLGQIYKNLNEYCVTDIYPLVLDREMSICFLRSPNGIFIEIIEI